MLLIVPFASFPPEEPGSVFFAPSHRQVLTHIDEVHTFLHPEHSLLLAKQPDRDYEKGDCCGRLH